MKDRTLESCSCDYGFAMLDENPDGTFALTTDEGDHTFHDRSAAVTAYRDYAAQLQRIYMYENTRGR